MGKVRVIEKANPEISEILLHHLPCRDRARGASSKSQDNSVGYRKTFFKAFFPGVLLSVHAPLLPQAFRDGIFTEGIAAFLAY